jgi:hypothetical protein
VDVTVYPVWLAQIDPQTGAERTLILQITGHLTAGSFDELFFSPRNCMATAGDAVRGPCTTGRAAGGLAAGRNYSPLVHSTINAAVRCGPSLGDPASHPPVAGGVVKNADTSLEEHPRSR